MKPASSASHSYLLGRWLDCVPPLYSPYTLKNCLDLPSDARSFGSEWALTFPNKSLFLWGAYGSGKTTFAFALIRELIRNHCPTRYLWANHMTGRQMDSKLLKALKEEGDEWEIKRYSQEDVLFIDDIDKISPTDRFKSQFFEIINSRLINNKCTIITSNCKLSELGTLFDGSVLSRMKDTQRWQIIQFPDRDLRQVKS